jgi:hypothetical protein
VRVVLSDLESLPRTSSLRKALDSVKYAKYEGIKSSRAALLEYSDNEDGSDGEVSVYTQGSPAPENENGYPPSGEENASPPASKLVPKVPVLEGAANETLEKIREDDRAKGMAIRNQTVSLID